MSEFPGPKRVCVALSLLMGLCASPGEASAGQTNGSEFRTKVELLQEPSRGRPGEGCMTVALPASWHHHPSTLQAQLLFPSKDPGILLDSYKISDDGAQLVAFFTMDRWVPKEVDIQLRRGDATVAIPVPVVRSKNENERWYGWHNFSELFHRIRGPKSLKVESHDRGPSYFEWRVDLPRGSGVRAEELTLVPACPRLVGYVVKIESSNGSEVVRVIGEFDRRGSRFGTSTIALDLRKGSRSIAQVVSDGGTHTWIGHRETRPRAETLQTAYHRQKLDLDPGEVSSGVWKVRTFSAEGSGYFDAVLANARRTDGVTTSVSAKVLGTDRLDPDLVGGTIDTEDPNAPIHVVGRYRKPGAVTIKVNLISAVSTSPVATLPDLILNLPQTGRDPGAKSAWEHFYGQSVNNRQTVSGHSPFLTYVHQLLNKRSGGLAVQREAETNGREPDLFSAFTGLAAVQEAVQLDGYRPPSGTGKRNVRLTDLNPPPIKSHPFQEMMGSKKPVLNDMDSVVPADVIYFHVSKLSTLFAMTDQLEDWGQDLAHAFEGTSRDLGLRRRYLDQLALDVSQLSRLFGDRIISDVGVVVSDPFLREGTEAAVILRTSLPSGVDMALGPARKRAVASGAVAGDSEWNGTPIQYWTTPDGRVSCHQAQAGSFRVIASSRAMLAKVLDCAQKKSESLAQSLDYQYMRTLYPASEGEEDGFLFLSDAFVRRMVGPSFKIGAARRMQCALNLTRLGNARRFAALEHEPAADIVQLVKNKYLEEEPLCPAGGSYAFAGEETVCSRHGSLSRLAPLSATPVERVTPAEAEAYKQFVKEYTTYWRTFFDPVGVRVRMKDSIALDTVILPLVENSIYTNLKTVLLGSPVELAAWGTTPTSLLSVNIALNRENLQKLESEIKTTWLEDKDLPSAWLGDSACFVLHDARPLFSLNFGQGSWLSRDLTQRASIPKLVGISYLVGFDMPMVVSLPVTSEAAASRFLQLSAQRALYESRNSGRSGSGRFGGSLDPYIMKEGGPAPILVIPMEFFCIGLRYYASVHGGRIWFSNQLSSLVASMQAAPPVSKLPAHVRIDATPGRGVLIEETRKLGLAEQQRRACFANLGAVWSLLSLERIPVDQLEAVSISKLGYLPFCPDGGRYSLDLNLDQVICSRHGWAGDPQQAPRPAADSAASRVESHLGELGIGFSFTSEGLATHVEIRPRGSR